MPLALRGPVEHDDGPVNPHCELVYETPLLLRDTCRIVEVNDFLRLEVAEHEVALIHQHLRQDEHAVTDGRVVEIPHIVHADHVLDVLQCVEPGKAFSHIGCMVLIIFDQ
jgi:hypothetical protein